MNSKGNIIYRALSILIIVFWIVLSLIEENLFMLTLICTMFILFDAAVLYSYIIERLKSIEDKLTNNMKQ